MKLASLQDLYEEELKDIYYAEKKIVKALPAMAKAATSPELKQAFQSHLEQTREHVSRLDQVFEGLGIRSKSKTCRAMDGIIAECEEFLDEDATPEVRDAGLISMAQRVEHYEIAAYGTVKTYAKQLGKSDQARLLDQTLREESETDKKLTQLAETRGVNQKATAGAR